MKILALRILPPMAIARLGAGKTPIDAYDLKVSDEKPLDFRKIVPTESLAVDPITGTLSSYLPDFIEFKEVNPEDKLKDKVKPVAPFLEVFAITDEDQENFSPVTEALLKQCGYSLADISWNVDLANMKIYRRTEDVNDKINASLQGIKDHKKQEILGHCNNFLPDKTLPFGTVQFIQPDQQFPGLRLRFTPGQGLVYGSNRVRRRMKPGNTADCTMVDPVLLEENQKIYDDSKPWVDFSEDPNDPKLTVPGSIYAGYADGDRQVSWGYIDDECDGFVEVLLKGKDQTLSARAHISAGPPAYAPDTLPVRVVSDELEQILLGTEREGLVPIEEAEDIVRRALETVRLMNTAIMNGNSYEGKWNAASTMVRQDSNDFGRYYEPIMSEAIVDNLAVLALHERVFTGLGTGAAPWFSEVFRLPNEIGDLSNRMRRKMPAMMRGADGRALTLTHRQINTVIKAATAAMFQNTIGEIHAEQPMSGGLPKVGDLVAQLHYQAKGNPFSVLPRTAISNCFPGLELDFRNLWRRAFKGLVLLENNNFVIGAEIPFTHLVGHRLVAVNNKPTMVSTVGPVFPDGDNTSLMTAANPNGVSFMEWSNSLAEVLQNQGGTVLCHFTKEESNQQVIAKADELSDPDKYLSVRMEVNNLFEENTAAFSNEVVEPGDLTQGLCSPWQNDYRECACYYWAASRPDFVNVKPDENGLSAGDNWMSKTRSGSYLPDDRQDSRLVSYQDLFNNWQGELQFIIKGKDANSSKDA